MRASGAVLGLRCIPCDLGVEFLVALGLYPGIIVATPIDGVRSLRHHPLESKLIDRCIKLDAAADHMVAELDHAVRCTDEFEQLRPSLDQWQPAQIIPIQVPVA